MVRFPPFLKKGDQIGLTCPAGYMAIERVEACVRTLEEWGYKVRIGKTVGSDSTNYFSGTDDERLADIQSMLDDREINAILCGRGGYGTGRIIDRIDFRRFQKRPKWVIGYSDITVLHCHLYSRLNISSLHSPMAGAFNDGGASNPYILSIRDALRGKKANYVCDPHPLNRAGTAEGPIVGGNLSLLANMIGTASDFKTKNRILFIEDVSEYAYHIDRMMRQLKRSGKLDRLAGLVVGGFTEMKDTERTFGQSVYEIIRDIVDEFDYPVCFDFPVSHTDRNYALRIGQQYRLSVQKKKVSLRETGAYSFE